MSDLRHALRLLRKDPGFTAVALLTLAVGIGANVAVFSFVNAVLLHPLPYAEPERIVRVAEQRAGPRTAAFMTNETFDAWRNETRTVDQIAGYTPRSYTLIGLDEPVRLQGAAVSPDLFALLRVSPAVGRVFQREEEEVGANRVVLLSTRLWERSFKRDEDVLGRVIRLDGDPHVVVGIMPPTFQFPDAEAELWTPLGVRPPVQGPNARFLLAFSGLARLKDGVTLEQAESEATTILQRLEAERARPGPAGTGPVRVQLTPLHEAMVAEFRPAMLMLWASVSFVLVIACANLANLMLARGATRQRELAIRAAIGGSRGRLVRLLLTESLVLSIAGGTAGALMALWLSRVLPAISPREIPRIDEVGVETGFLAFALVLSLVSGVLIGLVPALQGSRLNLVRFLNETSAHPTGGFRILGANRARSLIGIVQIALAFVLLVGGTLLVTSFVRLTRIAPGYDPSNVLTAQVPLGRLGAGPVPGGPEEMARGARSLDPMLTQIVDRITQLPGVAHAALVSFLPLSPGEAMIAFGIQGRPRPTDPTERWTARPQIVSAGYFQALGLRLVEGRFLTRDDLSTSPPVVVVNEAFARTYLPGETAVGKRLTLMRGTAYEVVGVVGDVRHRGLDSEPEPEFYVTYQQSGEFSLASAPYVVLKTLGDPVDVLPLLRHAIRETLPTVALDNAMAMEARVAASVAQPRFYALLVGLFALVALALALVGLYGVLSYTVLQRHREIGIRMALGAARGEVERLVFGQAFALIAVGTVAGLLCAVGTSRLIRRLLFGVTATDPATFVAVLLLLVATGLAAAYLPARRATRVDPMVALREG